MTTSHYFCCKLHVQLLTPLMKLNHILAKKIHPDENHLAHFDGCKALKISRIVLVEKPIKFPY
uniref:Uncharacterized protein n=1 Tax=Arundo donax TaxID=35708 RepID=A0A0A9EEI0_ARUDO